MGGYNWATEVTQGIQGDLMNADLMSRLVEVPPAVTFLPHTHDGSGELWGERTETLNLLEKISTTYSTRSTVINPIATTQFIFLSYRHVSTHAYKTLR